MNFSIQIKSSAARELGRFGKQDRVRIVDAIDRLAHNPYQGSALKGNLRGIRRIRAGQYRIMYEVQENLLVVTVVRVARRRDAYRRRRK